MDPFGPIQWAPRGPHVGPSGPRACMHWPPRAPSRIHLAEVACHHLALMKDKIFDDRLGLIQPYKASKELAAFVLSLYPHLSATTEVWTAQSSKHSVISTSAVGDVVLYRKDGGFLAGRVWAHVAVEGQACVILERFESLGPDLSNTSLWAVTDDAMHLPVQDIIDPVCFSTYAGGQVKVVHPFDLAFRL